MAEIPNPTPLNITQVTNSRSIHGSNTIFQDTKVDPEWKQIALKVKEQVNYVHSRHNNDITAIQQRINTIISNYYPVTTPLTFNIPLSHKPFTSTALKSFSPRTLLHPHPHPPLPPLPPPPHLPSPPLPPLPPLSSVSP
jgi:hypothetical protein